MTAEPATTIRFRPATAADLPDIVRMLADDPLGARRERFETPLPPAYRRAFDAIDRDPDDLLLVAADADDRVIAVLQLTYTPSITHQGSWRATIEGVRVDAAHRDGGLGQRLFEHAIGLARARGCRLVQLTTDKTRPDARRFYERLGFRASHEGMKRVLDAPMPGDEAPPGDESPPRDGTPRADDGPPSDEALPPPPLAPPSDDAFALTVERRIALPAATLYDAWTRDLDRWFAAPGSVAMRAEPGAPFRFETEQPAADGRPARRHPHYGRFLALEPGRRIVLAWVSGTGGTAGAETVVTIDLSPAGGGTLLRLAHTGFADAAARDRHRQAWPAVLAHLERTFSASPGAGADRDSPRRPG